jgi:hypothetical protein
MFAILAVVLVCGCGKRKEDETAIVKALGADKKGKAPSEEALEKRRGERLAKEKELKDAENRLQQAIDAMAVVPTVEIQDVAKACKAVAKAHDGFMHKHFDGEELDKWTQSKEFQLDMTRKRCIKHGSVEVAACQKHALENAGPELSKEVPALLMRCIDKFGKAE